MSEIVSVNIAGWMACLAFVLMVLNHGSKLVDRLKSKPTTAEVQAAADEKFVTSDHCQTLHADHERRIINLENIRQTDTASAGESRKLMYAKMDAFRSDISAEIRAVNKRVDDLSGEVRLVPGTVVRLISESKKI